MTKAQEIQNIIATGPEMEYAASAVCVSQKTANSQGQRVTQYEFADGSKLAVNFTTGKTVSVLGAISGPQTNGFIFVD